MVRQAALLLTSALLFNGSAAQADVLRMEETNRTIMMEPAISFVQTPTRAMNMDKVRSTFGEPLTEHPAVGDPPITRWDFENFHVFFEHNMVLHAVVPNQPLNVDHQDELQPANVSELR